MTIVLSNVNISEIKMGLLMDGVIDTMKCDEMWAMTVSFLCLFAVRSVPTLLFLGFVREGTVVPSNLPIASASVQPMGGPGGDWRVGEGEVKVFLPLLLVPGNHCCHTSPAPAVALPRFQVLPCGSAFWALVTLPLLSLQHLVVMASCLAICCLTSLDPVTWVIESLH